MNIKEIVNTVHFFLLIIQTKGKCLITLWTILLILCLNVLFPLSTGIQGTVTPFQENLIGMEVILLLSLLTIELFRNALPIWQSFIPNQMYKCTMRSIVHKVIRHLPFVCIINRKQINDQGILGICLWCVGLQMYLYLPWWKISFIHSKMYIYGFITSSFKHHKQLWKVGNLAQVIQKKLE